MTKDLSPAMTRSSKRGTEKLPRRLGVAGFTVLELLVSSFIALAVMYGASIMYLHYFRAMSRGKDKLNLQDDATYATEALVRMIRPADNVTVSNVNNPRLTTFRKGAQTGQIRVNSSTVNGKTYSFLEDWTSGGAVRIVPTPLDGSAGLSFTQTGTLVQFNLTLADTSGNKVRTTASAALRNSP
jgi:Tfp pilus assembly protein PilW